MKPHQRCVYSKNRNRMRSKPWIAKSSPCRSSSSRCEKKSILCQKTEKINCFSRLKTSKMSKSVLRKSGKKKKERLNEIKKAKENLESARNELEMAQRNGNFSRASELRYGLIPDLEKKLPAETSEEEETEGTSLVHERVTSADINRVVSRATGIPVQVT